jgi:hypothetical protein
MFDDPELRGLRPTMKFFNVALAVLGVVLIGWSIRVFVGGTEGTDSGDLYIAVGLVFLLLGLVLVGVGARRVHGRGGNAPNA